jgi:putative membrane protein
MKAKKIFTALTLGFSMLLACQNPGKPSKERLLAAKDAATNEHMVTDTSGLNRGANLSVFMNEVAIEGLMEIELAKLAQEKTSNSKVKDFANKMLKDYLKIEERLKVLANDKGMKLPASLPQADLDHLAVMKTMSGMEFDKHYIGMMVDEHIKTLDLFKAASTSGDSPLQNFAIRNLITLENHYKMATSLHDKLNVKGL